MIEEYPLLATLEELPLHGAPVEPEWWYGCQFPERPRDDDTHYDWRCHGCIRHAEASIVMQGDISQAWRYSGAERYKKVMLSWLVGRSKHLLDMP